MGCKSSKMDEDSNVVLQCLKRKRLMRDAVNYRHDFAFAHQIYIETLGEVGKALCRFAEADSSNAQSHPKSPIRSSSHRPAKAKPPLLATYVHPPRSPSADSRSPPLKTANRPAGIPPTSTTSPTRESSPSLGSDAGAKLPTMNSFPSYGDEDMMVSSPKTFDIFPPHSTSTVEESDGFLMPYTSSRPSTPPYNSTLSPPQRSSWDPFNFFQSSPLTYHTQQQWKMSEEDGVEDEMFGYDKIAREEGLPDLEEEGQDHETEQPIQNEGQSHRKESTSAHSEDRQQEPTDRSTQNSAENAVEEQEVNSAAIVPIEKKDDAVFTLPKLKNLTEAVKLIDDQFAKAVESVNKEVSGMLETRAIHRHESNLDFRDSARALGAIPWHLLHKTATHSDDTNETNHGADLGMVDRHALILERIYTWEKKLYEEVKAGEHLRMAFDRKCRQLSVLEGKGEDIEEAKVIVRSLDSELAVALSAVYSASKKIQQLTNEELYPQLAELLGGLVNMWKVMLHCHKTQKAIALALKSLETPKARVDASDVHRNATIALEHEIEKWQDHIFQWVSSQNKYINALFKWLRLCHAQPENDERDGAMSTSRTDVESSIYSLIENWHHSLTHFEENAVVDALKKFAGALRSLQIEQSEIPVPKRRVETFRKESDRRVGSILTMGKRYREHVLSGKRNHTKNQSNSNDIQQEEESVSKGAKKHQEEEDYRDNKDMQHTEKLSLLQESLPGIFEEMTDFAEVALKEYEELHQGTKSLKPQPDEQTSDE